MLYPRSVRLEPRRQLEMGSQSLCWLVYGEAGEVGRDLEQNSAWLAEVDRAEVLAITYRCNVVS